MNEKRKDDISIDIRSVNVLYRCVGCVLCKNWWKVSESFIVPYLVEIFQE